MSKRKHFAQGFASAFDDLSDGAFFAAMDEFGADVESLNGTPATPAKPWACPTCGRRFRSKHACARHGRDKHGAASPTTTEN